MTSSLETERVYFKGKDKGKVNKVHVLIATSLFVNADFSCYADNTFMHVCFIPS